MKRKLIFGAVFLVIISFLSCEQFFDPIDPDDSLYSTGPDGSGEIQGETVYHTSFESADDISGWTGLYPGSLSDDPAPGGGNKSLHVGGGCIQPTAWIDLQPTSKGGYYKISCWGKKDASGGTISLTIKGIDWSIRHETTIHVNDDNWAKYNSSESIYCPGWKSLRIEIWCGGIAGGSMFMDELSVIRVY